MDLIVGGQLNSGIQIRSEAPADESRSWIGGIYDEGRRGDCLTL